MQKGFVLAASVTQISEKINQRFIRFEVIMVTHSAAARTQKKLFQHNLHPRPKEFGASFTLTRALQLGTQGRQPSLCQCGSMGKAEQSQTVTSAVTISGCDVSLAYFPPIASTSFYTQRLSAPAMLVAGMIKQVLFRIPNPPLLQSQVHRTSECGES